MTYEESVKYLYSLIDYEKTPPPSPVVWKLERMKALLGRLGDPQNELRCIHIAGTKGKGSTCALTSHVLKTAGFSVGLYTSPHLSSFRERIRILTDEGRPLSHTPDENDSIFGDSISEDDFAAHMGTAKPHIEVISAMRHHGEVSFFECCTALSLLYFRDKGVDFAVLETGLGGRFDATNVVDATVCGITPISLEHTQILGDTVGAIAEEKAEIIKEGSWVISAPQPLEAEVVIRTVARERGAQLHEVGREIFFEDLGVSNSMQRCAIRGIFGEYPALSMRLLGHHQVVNAAVAVGLIEGLRREGVIITPDVVRRGFADAHWPGRLEIVREKPLVILDGAQNAASAQVVRETLDAYFLKDGSRLTLILGVSNDKDICGILTNLLRPDERLVITRATHPRAMDPTKIAAIAEGRVRELHIVSSAREALDGVLAQARREDVILITGSLFLVGELRKYLMSQTSNQIPKTKDTYQICKNVTTTSLPTHQKATGVNPWMNGFWCGVPPHGGTPKNKVPRL